jgi:hypothetical protein
MALTPNKEAGLGSKKTSPAWSEHVECGIVNADVVLNAALHFNIPVCEFCCLLCLSDSAANGLFEDGKKLSENASNHLIRIAQVEREAAKVFNSVEKGRNWLTCFHFGFKVAPIKMLDNDIGANKVLVVLRSMKFKK